MSVWSGVSVCVFSHMYYLFLTTEHFISIEGLHIHYVNVFYST